MVLHKPLRVCFLANDGGDVSVSVIRDNEFRYFSLLLQPLLVNFKVAVSIAQERAMRTKNPRVIGLYFNLVPKTSPIKLMIIQSGVEWGGVPDRAVCLVD